MAPATKREADLAPGVERCKDDKGDYYYRLTAELAPEGWVPPPPPGWVSDGLGSGHSREVRWWVGGGSS